MALASYPAAAARRPIGVVLAGTRATTHTVVVHPGDVARAGIASLLGGTGMSDVSHAATVLDALRSGASRAVALVLYDYTRGEGAAATDLLRDLHPRPRLIALVGRGGVTARECLAAGADGAIGIDGVTREGFLEAVRRIADGQRNVVAGFGATDGLIDTDAAAGPTGALTPRERQLLYLIGEGHSNREIADALVLSIKTVESHRANLARKLNIRSRSGLMRLALGASASAA